jgi:hypothetical protein
MPLIVKEDNPQSRNLVLLARDVMEGFQTLNPLVLKKFDGATCKELHRQLRKLHTTIRMEGIDLANQALLRARNHRLQRMHQAINVLEHHAKINKLALG